MIRLFIIGFLLLMPMTAISQPPSPAPSKTVKKPNTDTTNKQNNSKVTATIGTSVPDKPSTISSDEKHESKTSPEWWLVYLTGGLVLVTAALAVYTAKLWKSTKQSLDITKQSVDLTRKELILTQRPILRVSTVIISRNVLPGEKPGLVAVGKPVNVQFYIANVGGTPATITNIGCWKHNSASTNPLPMERPYEGKSGNISIMQILNPGESIPITLTSEPMNVDHQGVILGQYNVYVMGWIEYRDDLKINRRLNFCRKYDPAKGRFFPVADDDYENQY